MERFIAGLIIKDITIIKVGTNKSLMRPIVLFILHSTVSRCFSKDNRVSRMTPRCLWDAACITLLLLNTSGGCDVALDFRLKMTSCACFFGSGLKLIFHRKAHLCQVVIQFKNRGIAVMNHRK